MLSSTRSSNSPSRLLSSLCRGDASLHRLSFPLHRPAPQHQQPLSILPPVAMAADGRMRCRSRRMQGRSKMTSASGAEQMKPHHGIRGLVKSGGGNGKSGDRRIETHGGASGSVGHIVKPGAIDSEIKPSSAESWVPTRLRMRGSTYMGAESSGLLSWINILCLLWLLRRCKY